MDIIQLNIDTRFYTPTNQTLLFIMIANTSSATQLTNMLDRLQCKCYVHVCCTLHLVIQMHVNQRH